MRSVLRLWWLRIRALWKWLLVFVLLSLPIDWLHEWLRHWIAGQSGWLMPILRYIVNHPWFPWGLLPIGVLALVTKAYFDARRLTSGPLAPARRETIHIVRTFGTEQSATTRNVAGELADLYRRGESLRIEILEDENSTHLAEWRSRIDTWRRDVRQYLNDYVSPAKALYVDVIYGLRDVTILYRGKGLPVEKGYVIQDLEERLKRFAEILKVL